MRYKDKSVPQLKKILRRWFNAYIRLRDCNRDGIGKCISCGRYVEYGNNWEAGHFHPTTKGSLQFNEDNVNGQCKHCNRWLHGNLLEYRKNLVKKIGEQRVLILDQGKNNITRWYGYMLDSLIEVYKDKAKQEYGKKFFKLNKIA